MTTWSVKAERVLLSEIMESNSEDFEKRFSEIISSEDLKKISESFKKEETFTLQELLLIQQSLLEAVSNVSEILFLHVRDKEDLLFRDDNIYHSLLSCIYKICEDFNECMIEYRDELYEGEDSDDFDE